MNPRNFLALAAATTLALALLPNAVVGQQKSLKDQLVGTWSFVSSTGKLADGSPTWGTNPAGLRSSPTTAAFPYRSCVRIGQNMPPTTG